MLLGILLLPGVGGYWFLTHFNFTRFQAVRESGYHVLFRSAVVGIVFYLVAEGVVAAWCACCPPSIINFLDKYSPDPFTTEVILSLALALVLPYLFNIVYDSRKGVKRAARNAGEHVELLIIESVEEKTPVEITLRNRKIYIGLAGDTGVGGSPDADVAVVPMFSGYRDEKTQDLVITLDYFPIIDMYVEEKPSLTEEDFRVILPMSEIVSARLFYEDVYDHFSTGAFDVRPRRRTRMRK